MQVNETAHTFRQYTTLSIPRGVKWLVGIDEVGRGPLAGPVTVGAVVVPRSFKRVLPYRLRDSKQLTPLAREEWYTTLRAWRREGAIGMAVASSSAAVIDRCGIVPAVRRAVAASLRKLDLDPSSCFVVLDGSLKAPERFVYQETVIGGDDSEVIVSLASIAAKVTRDRYMSRLAARHPDYGFERHKGYGTLAHAAAVREHGLCDIHRRSFVKI